MVKRRTRWFENDLFTVATILVISMTIFFGDNLFAYAKPIIQSKTFPVTGPVNVLKHGAVPDWNGSTGTDNTAAFEAAFVEALSRDAPVYVPAAAYAYYIVRPNNTSFPPFKPTDHARLYGDGIDKSKIKFGPEPDQSTGFYLQSGAEFIIEDLTIEGASESIAAFHSIFADSGETIVNARRCKFTKGTSPIKMDGGTFLLDVNDCSFDVELNPVLANGGGGTVTVRHSTFRGGGHCLYINKEVSLLVEGCMFERSGDDQYGIHLAYGNRLLSEYVIIRGCVFKPDVAQQILTSTLIRTIISDCTFIGKPGYPSIQVGKAGAQLTNCRFVGVSDNQLSNFGGEDGDVIAANCTFEGAPQLANVYRHKDYGPTEQPPLWKFIGCDFRNENRVNGSVCVLANRKAEFEFDSCTFALSPEFDGDSQFTRIEGGRTVMRGCTILGQRSIWVTAAWDDVLLELWNNVFKSSDGEGLMLQPLGSQGITVRGSGNRFEGSSFGPNVIPREGYGAILGWLEPPAQIGEDIASADVMSVKFSESAAHVTGSQIINTLRVTGQNNPELIFHGPVRLIADNDPGFSLGFSGNIMPIHDNPRSQNEVVTLIHDPQANDGLGLWYETH